MANVAEKVSDMAKEKPVEKRRALGRGLESLLPGPRGVMVNPPTPSARSEESGREPAPSGMDGARTRKGEITGGDRATAPSSQVGATERRELGAPSEPSSSPELSGLHSSDSSSREPSSVGDPGSRAASPMAGLERAVVRKEVNRGDRAPTFSQSARKDGVPAIVQGSQVSGTERREPGVPSLPGTPSRTGASAPHGEQVGDLQVAASSNSFEGVEVRELPLDLIDKNPYQTRHFTQEDEDELIELGKSIKAQGLIQPVTVREATNGRFILIAGDRRTRAARWAEMKTIPAIVWDVTEQQAAEMTVIENLMREDLNCMDQTRAFVLLSSKFLMTQAEIAERMGMSRESVSNYMRLARLPQAVQDYLINGELEFSHARQLLKIEDEAMLLKVAERVAKEHIPVWELEEVMLGGVQAAFKAPDKEKQKRGPRWVDPNVKAAQRDLERVLGMRVRIRDRNNKGRIVIEYSTLEDFDRVVGALRGKGRV